MRCTRRYSWFKFCNHCTRGFMDFLRKPTLMSGAGTFDIYATSHMHQEALRTCVSHHDHLSKVALPSPTALPDITRFRADLLSYPMRFEAYISEEALTKGRTGHGTRSPNNYASCSTHHSHKNPNSRDSGSFLPIARLTTTR